MHRQAFHRVLAALAATLLATGCTCPSSFRGVAPPVAEGGRWVEDLSYCQIKFYGTTLLGKADSASTVKALLARGAKVNGTLIEDGKEYEGSALNLASEPEVVRALADAGAVVNFPYGKDGSLPLCRALRNGRRDMVDALLDAGAESRLADSGGESPLYMAAKQGDVSLCRAFIFRGARPDFGGTQEGDTPLMAALKSTAPIEKKNEVVQLLLAAGAEPVASGKDGATPLHVAPATLIPTLVAAGANVNCRDSLGRTPLFYGGGQDRIAILLQYGADINACDNEGNSAVDVETDASLKAYLLSRGCQSCKGI